MGGECSIHGWNTKFRIEYANGKNLVAARHLVEKTTSAQSSQSFSIIFHVEDYITRC